MSSWITFNTTGGTGNTTITITAASSTELIERIKTLRAETTSHKKNATVVVTQERYYLELSVSTEYLYFSGDTGETQEVCVFSNTAWTVSTNESWIHTSKTGSTGDDCFDVTVDGLTGDDIRWGEITITDGENTVTVFVVQSGDDYHYFIGVFESSGAAIKLYQGYNFDWDRAINIRIDKGEWEEIHHDYASETGTYHLSEGRHVVEYDFSYNPYPSTSPNYDNDTIYSAAFIIGSGVHESLIPLAFAIVTEGYETVGYSSFCNKSLKKIELRSSVLTTIQDNAFGGTTYDLIPQSHASIKEVYIPSSVSSLGMDAFAECFSLSSVTFGQNSLVQSIDQKTFRECRNLVNITLPNNLRTIGQEAFAYCPALTSISIPDTVTEIGNSAFAQTVNGERNLRYINIGNGSQLTKLGNSVFANTLLTDINLPDYMESIGNNAFENTKLVNFSFPEGVGVVEDAVFKNCTDLYSLTLPKDISNIGDYVFSGCSSLEKIYCNAIDCPIIEDFTTGGSPFYKIKTGGTLYYPTCSDYTTWLLQNFGGINLGYANWSGSSTLPCLGETFRMVPDSFARFDSGSHIVTIQIFTNYKWEATLSSVQGNAFSLSPLSGVGNYQLQLNVEANTGGTERSSILRIKTAHSDTGNIWLYQDLNIDALPKIKVTININDISQPTTISSGDTGAKIYKYRVDYGEWITKDTASTIDYQFGYVGTHVVEYSIHTSTTDSCVLPTDRSLVRGIELNDKITGLTTSFANNCTNMLSFIMSFDITTIPTNCFKNCSALTDHSFVLHSGITRIDGNAFYKNNFSGNSLNLTNVTSMGESAFESCSGLSSVVIDNLNSIPNKAFYNCGSLSGVTWKNSCTRVGEYAFANTSVLSCSYGNNRIITLPALGHMTSIGKYAFANSSAGAFGSNYNIELRFPIYMSTNSRVTACTINEGAFSTTGIHTISFCKSDDSPYEGTPMIILPTKCFLNCAYLDRINIENTKTVLATASGVNDSFENIHYNGVLHYKSSYECPSLTNTNAYHLGYYGWTVLKDL